MKNENKKTIVYLNGKRTSAEDLARFLGVALEEEGRGYLVATVEAVKNGGIKVITHRPYNID